MSIVEIRNLLVLFWTLDSLVEKVRSFFCIAENYARFSRYNMIASVKIARHWNNKACLKEINEKSIRCCLVLL